MTGSYEELRRQTVDPPPILEDKSDTEAGEQDMEVEVEVSDPMLSAGEVMRLGLGEENEDKLAELNEILRTTKEDIKKLNDAILKQGCEAAVMEVYSRPRIDAMARMWDLLPGWSLDLSTTDPDDGRPWDFTKQDKRDKAERLVREESFIADRITNV